MGSFRSLLIEMYPGVFKVFKLEEFFGKDNKCEKCSYPECSHTTDERYRYISKEATEMRLVGSSNGVNYYMEFVTRQGEKLNG